MFRHHDCEKSKILLSLSIGVALGCSGQPSADTCGTVGGGAGTNHCAGTGGHSTGGTSGKGGGSSLGGASATGGKPATGGVSTTGGVLATGGMVGTGGASGGSTGQGGSSSASPRIGESLANYLLSAWPNLNVCTAKDWEYTNGVAYYGMLKLYEKTGNTNYRDYVKSFVDSYVDSTGNIDYRVLKAGAAGTGGAPGTGGASAIAGASSTEGTVAVVPAGCVAGRNGLPANPVKGSARDTRIQDVMQPSNLLFTLYSETNDARYMTAMTSTRNLFPTIQKNSLGGFFHKPTYPYQMWLDSLYMSEPFITRYGRDYADVLDPTGVDKQNCFDTATFQFKLIAAETMDRSNPDPVKRLPVHAWVDLAGLTAASLTPPTWADATTGRSSVVWDRALGWYVMGLVDVLENLPADHADYSALVGILNDIVPGLKATQDLSSGLWYQVVDQGSLTDNWIETSGSAMFIYALKKAARAGYISSQYDAVATRGWQGLKSKVVILGSTVTVQGAVGGMSVMDDYAQYVAKISAVADNVPQGIAAVLLAASEMEY